MNFYAEAPCSRRQADLLQCQEFANVMECKVL